MFVEFYYLLRKVDIPVSITELLSLMEALNKGLIQNSYDFYFIARSLLVKDEKYFDRFDQVFMYHFQDAKIPQALKKEIDEWLKDDRSILDLLQLTPEERKKLQHFNLEELRQLFEQRMREQQEKHQGGNKWIGTRGKSPFGWGGIHPGGIRVGGWSANSSAIKIAQQRRFRAYRPDRILDTRQIQIALRKLRKLNKIGAPDVLNLDETIRKTCNQGGEIEFIWEKRKKNNLKLMLLMDIGGSMKPFTTMVETLFSAANKLNHFKLFVHYYFHNCIYDQLYHTSNLYSGESSSLTDIFKKHDSDFRVVLVGDAAMSPYELTMPFGSIDFHQRNETPGIIWLKRFKKHYPKSIWLNPEQEKIWIPQSRKIISSIFSMYPLSLDGLETAIQTLL